jgi:hypothetical protein
MPLFCKNSVKQQVAQLREAGFGAKAIRSDWSVVFALGK